MKNENGEIAFPREEELIDMPFFNLVFLDGKPPKGLCFGTTCVTTFNAEDVEDFVSTLFDLSMSWTVNSVVPLDTWGDGLEGYRIYIYKSRDHQTNITPEFVEHVKWLCERRREKQP